MIKKLTFPLLFFLAFTFVLSRVFSLGTAIKTPSVHTYKSGVNQSNDKPITLIATGDVMLGRTVNFKTVASKDFSWPFLNVSSILKKADITLVNLESPLVSNCELTNEGMIFCGDIKHGNGLSFAGVDIVSIANNHAGDQGDKGIQETINYLSVKGIDTIGTRKPLYITQNGQIFSFLAYNNIPPYPSYINHVNQNMYEEDIALANKNSDIVIVSFHWGEEYTAFPTTRQVQIAHKAIDAGADVVIGHHPHWIQPVEMYKDKPIFYSLGNFVFDQMWSQKTREGLAVKFTFENKTLKNYELIPIVIENFGQPRLANEKEKEKILKGVNIHR